MNIDKLIDVSALSAEVQMQPNQWKGEKSKWSKHLDFGYDNEETIGAGIAKAFGISNFDKQLFHMAVNGDGQELKRICTLHSSSLLAFLFFCGVSDDNKLVIDGIEYDKCFFEVQNRVFTNGPIADKPSNVDVVLYSSKSNWLLFIESKFTEYLSHGKAFAAEKYKDVVSRFITHGALTLRIEEGIKQSKRKGFNICLKEGKNNQYITGFKQAIAHIVGILTGEPTEHNPENYKMILNKKPS